MPTLYTSDSFAKIQYATAFGVHSSTIPFRLVSTLGLGDPGTVESWNGDPISPATMVETMIDKMAEVVPSTTTFNKYTLYKWNGDIEEYQPFYEAASGIAGSAVGLTGQAKAVQQTVSIKTLGFGLLKIVFLDRASGGVFGNVFPDATMTEIVAEAVSLDNAWCGRDQTRPAIFTNTSISLNKRLRRKYGMV